MKLAGIYPGSCPTCAGVISTGSIIDNGSMTYYHDAWDYRAGSAGGCAPCGAMAGGGESATDFSLGRIHRYLDLDWGASFGPGVLSTYDLRLQIFADARLVQFFDPLQRTICTLTDPAVTGVFHDGGGISRSLEMRDGAGRRTADLILAATAVLELQDGRTLTFQTMPMAGAPAGSADQDARLTTIADRSGRTLTLSYADPAVGFDYTRIVDGVGRVATVTWGTAAGQSVILSVGLPGGGTITYHYGDDRMAALSRIEYPTGEVSTFRARWDEDQQLVALAISDAGADTTHRRKTLRLTPSIENGPFGGLVPQLPNRIRQLHNGAGELLYRNWLSWEGEVMTVHVFSGGGPDGLGILRRLRYRGGIPVGTDIARYYLPGQDFASLEWIPESAYQTDALMRPTTMADPLGSTTTYDRDVDGNITRVVRKRPDGSIISTESTTWDSRRNPLEVTDALGRMTRNAYDAGGRLTRRTVAVGTPDEATWAYAYDDQGRLISAVDANGNATETTYDLATGQVASIQEPGDTPTGPRPTRRFAYDEVGRLASTSDPEGRTVTYAYDARGRPTRTTYADGTTDETVYGIGDDANLVTRRKNRLGQWEDISYDAAGRQMGATLNAGKADAVVRTWAYVPGKDLVSSETVNGRTTTYVYDESNRIAAVTTWASATASQTTSSESWEAEGVSISTDAAGRRAFSLTSADGLRSRSVREAHAGALVLEGSTHDQAAALWALSRPTGASPAYTIDDTVVDVAGQVVSRTDATGISVATVYDAQGRTTAESTTDPITGQTVTTAFTYDANGNRTEVVLPRSFAPDAPGRFVASTTYTGRNLPATQTQAFTPAGSTQPTQVVTTATTYTPTGKTATQSDPRNAAWLTSFQYGECCDRLKAITDAMGFTSGTTSDAEGRVTASTDANGHVSQTTYDTQGRVATRLDAQGRVTRITYDEDLTDGVGLDARFASIVADLGFGPQARGSAVLTVAASNDFSLVIQDGLGREVCRVQGKMP